MKKLSKKQILGRRLSYSKLALKKGYYWGNFPSALKLLIENQVAIMEQLKEK